MVCVGGCFGSGERYKKIIYYEDVRVGDRFYSSETGEEYTKNTDDLYYEDFDPKSLVYVDKNDHL